MKQYIRDTLEITLPPKSHRMRRKFQEYGKSRFFVRWCCKKYLPRSFETSFCTASLVHSLAPSEPTDRDLYHNEDNIVETKINPATSKLNKKQKQKVCL